MPPPPVMQRKIGEDEADEGFLFVEKSWLSKLPPPGQAFHLTVGRSNIKTKITESELCRCREPEHKHYRIPLPLMNPSVGKMAKLRVVKEDKLVLDFE